MAYVLSEGLTLARGGKPGVRAFGTCYSHFQTAICPIPSSSPFLRGCAAGV